MAVKLAEIETRRAKGHLPEAECLKDRERGGIGSLGQLNVNVHDFHVLPCLSSRRLPKARAIACRCSLIFRLPACLWEPTEPLPPDRDSRCRTHKISPSSDYPHMIDSRPGPLSQPEFLRVVFNAETAMYTTIMKGCKRQLDDLSAPLFRKDPAIRDLRHTLSHALLEATLSKAR